MNVLWTDKELQDAMDEHQGNQPNSVIAELLNKKHHNGQPVRTPIAVKARINREEKRLTSVPDPPQQASAIPPEQSPDLPPVVAQVVAEELKGLGNVDIEANLRKLIGNPPQEPHKINDTQETELSDDEIDDFIKQTAVLQPAYQKSTGIVRCPDIKIPEKGWFAIVFSSDWHIGSIWTQLLTILYEAQIIATTPGMYVFFGGDSVDGGIPAGPHGGILNEQIMPPHMQRACAMRIIRLMGGKLKMAATGCHEWWSQQAADYDFIHDAVKDSDCTFLGGGTKYYLKASGGGEWTGCYHHKASGHSIYNDFHPCSVRAQRHEQDADIICVAHEHIVGTSIQVIGERRRYMARPGARKSFDSYASKLGNDAKRDDMDVPVLLLHGTHGRRVKGQWIEGIPMAAVMLTMLRQADPFAKLSA